MIFAGPKRPSGSNSSKFTQVMSVPQKVFPSISRLKNPSLAFSPPAVFFSLSLLRCERGRVPSDSSSGIR